MHVELYREGCASVILGKKTVGQSSDDGRGRYANRTMTILPFGFLIMPSSDLKP